MGQTTENPLVQLTEFTLGNLQVIFQSSWMLFKAHSSVFAGLPYLVAEQSVCLALLNIKIDKVV
jgi:hypothetical protein